MFETKLAMRLQSSEPKCANCRLWKRGDPISKEHGEPTVGFCQLPNNGKEVGEFGRISVVHLVMTTDLSVCSKWESKD